MALQVYLDYSSSEEFLVTVPAAVPATVAAILFKLAATLEITSLMLSII
jgi:hypothetical protein